MSMKSQTQLIRYAGMAPSVHNTQPWRFRISGNQVEVLVDPASVLKHGDPALRQLWISLGACLENLVLAAPAVGFRISNISYQYPQRPAGKTIAKFSLAASNPAADKTWLSAISQRGTDRHHFLSRGIKASTLSAVQYSWRSENIKVVLSNDHRLLELLGKLTRQGMTMALGHPKFRAELNQLVHFNWKKTHTGLPGYVLKRSRIGSILEKAKLKSGLRIKRQAAAEGQLVAEGPAVILIFSRGDVPKYWLEAGRAYQHTVLKATGLGLHN